jgi:predicted ATPase
MLMSGTMVLLLAQLDEALVHLGQFDQALVELNETLAVVNEKDDRFFESEFHRLKGECLLALSPDNALEAEVCFNQARAVSGKQGAKSLELRATMNLAKLWQQQGKPAEAQRVLAIIYSAFTEGFDTPDLREAAKILQQLA